MAIQILTEQVDKYGLKRTLDAHPLNISTTLSMNDSLNSRKKKEEIVVERKAEIVSSI
jgi:hypothetical protein